MKRNFFAITLIALLFSMVLTGCEKENFSSTKSIPSSYSIRHFDNINQLCDEIQYLGQLDYDAIADYESSINFNSFGKLAYNALENATKDTTISLEKLRSNVAQYSEYLHFYIENKDEYLDIRYDNSPFTFIMNEDRMFIVGEQLYKVFENCVVTTKKDNFETLLAMDEKGVSGFGDNENYIILPTNTSTDDIEPYYGSYLKEINHKATNGKERVKTFLYSSLLGYQQGTGNGTRVQIGLIFKIKGFRKFAGIFWPVKRTLSCDIEGLLVFNGECGSGSDNRTTFAYSHQNLLVSITKYLEQNNDNPNYGIYAANGYGRIPAVKAEYNYHY